MGSSDAAYEHEWSFVFDRGEEWRWLCDPDGFIDGQIRPWQVEFPTNDDGPGEFSPGVFNAHTRPFMSFAGIARHRRRGVSAPT